MTRDTAIKEVTDSKNQLKNIVERSLAVLARGDDAARTEICRRSLPLHMDAVTLQKSAVGNAAKALASLWKISKPARPGFHERVIQYSR